MRSGDQAASALMASRRAPPVQMQTGGEFRKSKNRDRDG
jgi:hypothetical protein